MMLYFLPIPPRRRDAWPVLMFLFKTYNGEKMIMNCSAGTGKRNVLIYNAAKFGQDEVIESVKEEALRGKGQTE